MKYVVTDAFTQISETTGTIQNASRSNLVEVSDSPVAGSGILLEPNDMFPFSGKTLYARCSDGKGAEVRVVPFEIGATSGGGGATDSGGTGDARTTSFASSQSQIKLPDVPELDAVYNSSASAYAIPLSFSPSGASGVFCASVVGCQNLFPYSTSDDEPFAVKLVQAGASITGQNALLHLCYEGDNSHCPSYIDIPITSI